MEILSLQIASIDHFDLVISRTIDINTGLPYQEGWVNAVKSLIFQSFIETILQLYGFITNPALRSTFRDNTELIQNLCLLDCFVGKGL